MSYDCENHPEHHYSSSREVEMTTSLCTLKEILSDLQCIREVDPDAHRKLLIRLIDIHSR